MINTVTVLKRDQGNGELVKAIRHDSRFQLVGSLESFSVMMDVAAMTRVDCVICDAIAKDMDFHECSIRMADAGLGVQPRLVVLCPSVSSKIFERFVDLGAADVIPADTDIPKLLNRVASDQRRDAERAFAVPDTEDSASRDIKSWLLLLDISPKLCAYRYIHKAMLLCRDDPAGLANVTKNLYKEIAHMNGTRPENVERAIRHGILTMWKKASPRFINELFGNPVKARSEKPPTNREFLAALYERLFSVRSIPARQEMMWAAEPQEVYGHGSRDGERAL